MVSDRMNGMEDRINRMKGGLTFVLGSTNQAL